MLFESLYFLRLLHPFLEAIHYIDFAYFLAHFEHMQVIFLGYHSLSAQVCLKFYKPYHLDDPLKGKNFL